MDGFLVDDELITHVVVERGRPWNRRDIAIPVGAVAHAESDAVTLRLTKDEVSALAR